MKEAMSSSLGILCIVLVHGNLRMRLYRYGLQYRPLPRVAVRQRLRPIKDERMTRTKFCQSLSLTSSVTRARTPRSGRLRVTYQFWCSPGWSLAIRIPMESLAPPRPKMQLHMWGLLGCGLETSD
jgi:hypothetical protein